MKAKRGGVLIKFIDLSHLVDNVQGEPDQVVIEELTHEEGARVLGSGFGISAQDFPNGYAINNEKVTLTTHAGTHLDAPYHFGPVCMGQQSKKIKDIPLDWCFGRGVLFNLSEIETDQAITADEIKEYMLIHDVTLSENNIVLIYTGADKYWGTKEYFTNFRGMSPEATNFLLDYGIKVIGIDSFGFDPPFNKMLTKYNEKKDQNELWPAHLLGREREYCHIERVANLIDLLENPSFYISCFPIKINTGASWVRLVAIITEEECL